MLKFHASIHGGVPTAPLPLSISFEQASAALERLDRLFIEPDGSFVWRGALVDGGAWQVDGNLIDRGDTLAHVELKGFCPDEQLNLLLAAAGWPEANLVFQLSRQGLFVQEREFRQRAATVAGAY